MSDASIVVIGNANVDLTTYLKRAPETGETVLGHGFSIGMGGKGANQAVAAARAGATVCFLGRVGNDAFGDQVVTALTSEGLDLTQMDRVDTDTAVASIYVEDSGANRIAVYPGASGTLTGAEIETAVEHCDGGGILVSQLEVDHQVVLAALTAATNKQMVTVLNIAPFNVLAPGILDHTTWLIANEVELEGVMGSLGVTLSLEGMSVDDVCEAISSWSEKLGCHLIITLGEQGAVGFMDGACFSYTAYATQAIDTVGAGDCFVGYFVALLDQRLPWQQALAGGVIAATQSVQSPGAQSSYPSRSDAAAIKDQATSVTF